MDVSDIIYYFSARETGRGQSEALGGGGGDFLSKIPGGGVSWAGGGGRRASGWEGVCGEFRGGGLNIFFRGRNVHQV